MSVLDHAMDNSLSREEHASRHLAGGIANHGYQCGMPWGAALFTGAQIYRMYGSGPQAEAASILAAQKIEALFRSFTKNKINASLRNCSQRSTIRDIYRPRPGEEHVYGTGEAL